MKKATLGPILILCLFLNACAAKTYTVHPGAVSAFDSQSYDSLLVAHSVIETCKADLAAGKFPASISGNVKTALNDLVTAYNVADTAYLAYHAAAVQGVATTAQVNAVTNGLTAVNVATGNLTAAKGGM